MTNHSRTEQMLQIWHLTFVPSAAACSYKAGDLVCFAQVPAQTCVLCWIVILPLLSSHVTPVVLLGRVHAFRLGIHPRVCKAHAM